jgi:hypothetical protein
MPIPYASAAAIAFFAEHAGGSYDPRTQTPEQGKQAGAERLALAEATARELGFSFEWSIDPDVTSADWVTKGRDGSKGRDPWQTWVCLVHDADGEVIGSLGGIDFGRDGKPWGDPYRRVVEAELALEHTPTT